MTLPSRVLDSPTGASLRLYTFRPKTPPRAVLLIFHGLAEHAARYAAVGAELSAKGVCVYAHDHRGHGSTTAADAPLRRFGSRNGAAKVLRDCQAVRHLAAEENPGCPIFVLGQSMGAHIGLNFARTFGEGLAGLLLWNAGFERGLNERLGVLALRAEKALKGSDVASRLFERATFGAWSRAISPRRTAFDWLSHDANAVDRYRADPLCGWTPTVSMVETILEWHRSGSSHAALADIPRRLPVHCLGGDEDPATEHGKAVRHLAARLEEVGLLDVQCHIVAGARHECLHEAEPMRSEAIEHIASFIERIISHPMDATQAAGGVTKR